MTDRDLRGEHGLIALEYTGEREYWLNKLSGDWEKSIFPPDYKKESAGRETAQETFQFPREISAKLMQAMNGSDSRLLMILAAGLVLLVNKYTGNKDIVVGTSIDKQEIEGEYVNTALALKLSLEGSMSFKSLLLQTRQTIVEARENQNYPIEVLPYELNIPGSDNHEADFPLFDIAVLLENIQDRHYLHDIKINVIFSFLRTGDTLVGTVDYNTHLYGKTTIKRIIGFYTDLLSASLAAPNLKIADISLLSGPEKKRLLVDFNNTRADYDSHMPIHELFRRQVEKTPGNTAVLEADSLRKLSFRELNENADRLAGLLIERGVGRGTVVPVMGQRKIEIITGILAILKAGGAYLPIDATSPPDRIKFILRDSSATIILTQRHLIDRNKDIFQILEEKNILTFDEESIYRGESIETGNDSRPIDPAYVIYTSGSTGIPKGVLISHRSVVNYIAWAAKTYVRDEPLNFPLYSSISFDMTVTSLFTPLLTGSTLVLYGGDYGQFLLEKIIEENKVGVVKVTPSHLKLIRGRDLRGTEESKIKRFIVGGEEFDIQLAEDIHARFGGNVEFYNEYGPTEATVGCMIHKFVPGKSTRRTVPIGVPADNTEIYLLDKNLDPVPPGIAGEIYIAGDGIALGYLNRPELTDERFTNNPFTQGRRMYGSGDLGRLLHDGEIEFLGRVDNQLKIRGFRIEPGEIENQLLMEDNIKEAVVIPMEDAGMDIYLCAYIVPSGPHSPDTAGAVNIPGLRESLSQRLPDYMIPSFFVQLKEIPLTHNGKIDKRALPAPEVTVTEEHIAPRNEMEEKLAEIWSGVLEIEKETIGIDLNFFEVGGHSLRATILETRIHKELNARVPLITIFEKPTIRGLAEYLNGVREETFLSIPASEKKEYYVLSSAQKRLYISQQLGTGNTLYNVRQVVPLGSDVEKEKLEKTFAKMIHRHESLRTSFDVIGTEAVQRVWETVDFAIEYYEEKSGEKQLGEIIEDFVRPFDFARAPLLRTGLIKTVDRKYLLLFDMHHIVTDAKSLEILKDEFAALYSGEELEPLRLQYRDFAEWQNGNGQQERMELQEQYWLSLFSGELPSLNLPTDFERSAVKSFEGDSLNFVLDADETRTLRELAEEQGATNYMSMFAVFGVLISKLCGQENIAVGMPVEGRRHADLEGIVGMFINTLPIRSFPTEDKPFKDFLMEVKHHVLEALENQDYQLEELVEKLSVKRDLSRNPLVDVVFNFIDRREEVGSVPKTSESNSYGFRTRTSTFDIVLTVDDLGEILQAAFIYSSKLFRKETISRFIVYFKEIVASIKKDKNIKLKDISISHDLYESRINANEEDYTGFEF